MNIKQNILDTKDYWGNLKELKFIIIHHTGSGWTVKGDIDYFDKEKVYLSSHYITATNWEIIQLVPDDKVAWHCWISEWWKLKNLNDYSIWIEVDSNWTDFTQEQIKATWELVVFLCNKYNIPKENVLRHKDIAPTRKWDVWDNFWKWFTSFTAWVDNLFLTQADSEFIDTIMRLFSKYHNMTSNPKLQGLLSDFNKWCRLYFNKK